MKGNVRAYRAEIYSMHTLASPSAARCAYMLGCNETLSMFLAWGRDDSAQDKLGRAISFSAETPDFC